MASNDHVEERGLELDLYCYNNVPDAEKEGGIGLVN